MRAAPCLEISTISITKSRSLFFNLAALLFHDYRRGLQLGKRRCTYNLRLELIIMKLISWVVVQKTDKAHNQLHASKLT
jgi:hypothetical protein